MRAYVRSHDLEKKKKREREGGIVISSLNVNHGVSERERDTALTDTRAYLSMILQR